MSQELPHETIPVLLRRRTKEISGRELVGWAEQALVDDFDSPALRRLAGLDMDGSAALRREEALLLFQQALDELGCRIPSEDDVVRLYVAGVARRILDGDLSPREGASKIHEDVLTPLNHPRELMDWCYLNSGIWPEHGELSEAECDQKILDLTRESLKKPPPNP